MKRTIGFLTKRVEDWNKSVFTPFTVGMVVSCTALSAVGFGYNESRNHHISEDDRLEMLRVKMMVGGLYGSIIGGFWPISIPILSTTVAIYLIVEGATRKK